LDKSRTIVAIALITLALSVFFIIYVPAVHHPTYVNGDVSDNFPSVFESLAYIASVFFVLPASAVALVIVFIIKAKERLVSKSKRV
jgi:hypothetical protein